MCALAGTSVRAEKGYDMVTLEPEVKSCSLSSNKPQTTV